MDFKICTGKIGAIQATVQIPIEYNGGLFCVDFGVEIHCRNKPLQPIMDPAVLTNVAPLESQ